MSRVREGGCCCGAVRYRVEGQPRVVSHCHCLDCRRTSGAPFVTWAEYPDAAFTWTRGEPGEYATRPEVMRTFCRSCGTQLTFRYVAGSTAVDVSAGSMDAPDDLEITDHLWCDRLLPWLVLDDGLPRFGRNRRDG